SSGGSKPAFGVSDARSFGRDAWRNLQISYQTTSGCIGPPEGCFGDRPQIPNPGIIGVARYRSNGHSRAPPPFQQLVTVAPRAHLWLKTTTSWEPSLLQGRMRSPQPCQTKSEGQDPRWARPRMPAEASPAYLGHGA